MPSSLLRLGPVLAHICPESEGLIMIFRLGAAAALCLLTLPCAGASTLPHPVLFVTQTPTSAYLESIGTPFGNQRPDPDVSPRGGDLMILYPGDTVPRNLTQEAGFGSTAGQEIAVREPCVSWDGTRALFSMVVGGTTQGGPPVYWQI